MKRVALTFDDGPNPPYTQQILDILKKENVKATFFVCGANIKRNPGVAEQEVKNGHQIGNHTWHHHRTSYLLGQIKRETDQTQKLLDKVDPKNKKLFRFPWGFEFPHLVNQLKKLNYQIVHVGIFGDDWISGIKAEKIAQIVAKRLKDEIIITLHDGHNTDAGVSRAETVKALPQIIKNLKQQGYQFVFPQEIS